MSAAYGSSNMGLEEAVEEAEFVMKYIKDKFDDVLITKLSVPDIQRMFNELLDSGEENNQGLASSTVRGVEDILLVALIKQSN